MTYRQFWEDDCNMVIAYRKADELSKERQNEYLWIQGMYIYRAMICASPALNPLMKVKKPFPYMEEPIPITYKAAKRKEEEDARKLYEKNKEDMMALMDQLNKSFREKRRKEEKADG
jgi:hypothetical protein